MQESSTMDSALDYQVASISEDATLHDSETAALFKSLLSEQRQNAGLKRASEEDLNSSQPHAPVRKKSKDDYDVQVGPAPIQLDPLDGAGAEDWSDTLASLQASLGMYPTAPSPFEPFESDSLGIGDYGVPFDLATLPTYPSTTTTPELAPLDFERLLASAGPPPPPIPTAQAPLSPGSQRRHDLEQIQAGLSGCAPSPQVTSTTETSVDLSIDPSLYQVDQKEGHDSQRAADEASLQQTFAEFFASASAQAPVASANASAPTVISLGETAGSDLPLPPPVVSAPAFATPRPTPPLSQSARPLPQPPPPPPRAPLPNADGSTNPGPTAREAAALFHGDDDNHHPCPSTGCDRKFARKSDFLRHYRIHTNERPFRCDRAGCGKSFIQRSALTVHTRVHSGEKPHVCGECQRQFSDSSSLARHRRVHAGVKPFVCEKCKQKSFSRKATLTRHENTCKGPNSRRSKKKGTPTASADNTDEAPSQSTTDTSFSASTSPEDSLDLDLDLDLNETASPSSHQSPPAPPPPPAQVALDFALLDPALAALDSQRPASSTTTSSVPLPPARFTNTSGLSLPRPSFVAPAAPPPPFLAESQARTALQPVSRSSAAVGVEMRTGAVGGTKAGTGAGVKAGKTAEAMRVSAEQQAAIALVGVGCAKSAGEKGR